MSNDQSIHGNQQSQEQIISRFQLAHNSRYDYSKVVYKNRKTPVIIICDKHGEFQQRPDMHYEGKGCQRCAVESRRKPVKNRFIRFINTLKEKQPKEFVDGFDFSDAVFVDQKTLIRNVKCLRTNTVSDLWPNPILKGLCCASCKGAKLLKKQEHFLENCKKVHGNRYDYSKVVYVKTDIPVIIICKYHGEFLQRPHCHANDRGDGNGCPVCCASKGESKIEMFLKQHNIEHIFEHKVKIGKFFHWYDFYLPKNNLIIEFHGLQHYQLTPFWGKGGGKAALKLRQERDKNKEQWCKDNNVNLVVIPYSQLGKIDEVLEAALLTYPEQKFVS